MVVGRFFVSRSAQIRRISFFFHNSFQQPLPNNGFDIVVEIISTSKNNTITIVIVSTFTIWTTISCRLLLLLLLLLIVAVTTTSQKKNGLITESIFQKIHENLHSGNYHSSHLQVFYVMLNCHGILIWLIFFSLHYSYAKFCESLLWLASFTPNASARNLPRILRAFRDPW